MAELHISQYQGGLLLLDLKTKYQELAAELTQISDYS